MKLKRLIIKRFNKTISTTEQSELDQYISQNPSLKTFIRKIEDPDYISVQYKLYKQFGAKEDWKEVVKNIPGIKAQRRLRVVITRIAAVLLIPLMLAALLIFFMQDEKTAGLIAKKEISIEPGKSEAVLILSNGEKVLLDYTKDTTMNEAGSLVRISKSKGILYMNEKEISGSDVDSKTPVKETPQINTLKIERGREFYLTLADGSKVWLNSETELQFPVSFIGDSREIYLKGEAYFEVSENKELPFIVHTRNMDLRVTGTSFNITAYDDESDVRATLVEGQVIVNNTKINGGEIILQPNQQAIVSNDGVRVKEVNASLLTEWRNNAFGFEYENLPAVVNKISRWYDVEFVYADESIKGYHFSGKIPKYENISTALELLELTTNIHFKLNEGKIVIEKQRL